MFRIVVKARGTREECTIHVHSVRSGEGAVRAGRWQSVCVGKQWHVVEFWVVQHGAMDSTSMLDISLYFWAGFESNYGWGLHFFYYIFTQYVG